MSLSKLKKLKE
jgi:hypothetical protein